MPLWSASRFRAQYPSLMMVLSLMRRRDRPIGQCEYVVSPRSDRHREVMTLTYRASEKDVCWPELAGCLSPRSPHVLRNMLLVRWPRILAYALPAPRRRGPEVTSLLPGLRD